MILNLFIVFIIFIFIIVLCGNFSKAKCIENESLEIKEIIGFKFNGLKISRKIGIPTLNYNIETSIPCGIYYGFSEFGEVIIFVENENLFRIYVYYLTYYPKVDNTDVVIFTNIKRLIDTRNAIINTFNKGCCN